MILVLMLAVSVLAAFGLQDLIDEAPRTRRSAACVVATAALVGLAALVAARPGLGDLANAVTGLARRTTYLANISSIYYWLLISASVGVLLYLRRRSGRHLSVRYLAVTLTVLATGDMLHFSHDFQTMAPASWAQPQSTPALAYLKRHAGSTRVGALGNAMPADSAMKFGLADVRGYDPPQPSLRYLHLWQFVNPSQSGTGLTIPELPSVAGTQVLDTLGMGYLLSDGPAAQETSGRLVYRGSDAYVYREDAAAPAALIPGAIDLVRGEQGSLDAITRPGFDPRRSATVEVAQPGAAALSPGRGTVRIISDVDAAVQVNANLTRGGLVVLNDAWADGWTVRVDGRPRPLLRVNDVMRGVTVPAGSHAIRFSYRVPGLRLGAKLSLLTLLVLVAGSVGSVLVGRRNRIEHCSRD